MKNFNSVFRNNLSAESFVRYSTVKNSDTILFELSKYGIDAAVARQLLDHVINNIELTSFVSDETGDMIMRLVLNAYVNDSEYIDSRPASWFDMFKIAYFPEWVLKKFPPKMIEKHVQKKTFLVDGKKIVEPRKIVLK